MSLWWGSSDPGLLLQDVRTVSWRTVNPPVYVIGYESPTFSAHSAMAVLGRRLEARELRFEITWRRVASRSWTAGEFLRRWGIRHSGSGWNCTLPVADEFRFLRQLPKSKDGYIVHFMWGEFASPKRVARYHRKGCRVVVTVHCSARRWDSVWIRPDGYARADHVVLTSESQRPFVERHVPADRISVIPLGVETNYFRPAPSRRANQRLRLFLLGNTERDHAFIQEVGRRLPPEQFELRVRTDSQWEKGYRDVACATILPRLSDEQLLDEYQQADVQMMAMLDSAANCTLLESMSCGTPVMVNRLGGVVEYVDPACNVVMENDRQVDAWVERLCLLEKDRGALESMRPRTRSWAERFDWRLIADRHRDLYRRVLSV